MFRVMIVEDEEPILDLMRRWVEQHPMLEVAGTFASAAKALAAFAELQPDAAFLDIEMPRMGGIELAEKLIALDDSLQIVFTTAYPEYALEAFRVSAVDYLLKPVEPEDVERVVARLVRNQSRRIAPALGQEEPTVRCLGTFETRRTDGSLIGWPTRKTEELFAYFLVYANRLTSKWQLTDLLWPDLEEERAIHNLHHSIHRLKKALKEAGITIDLANTNEGYYMRLAPTFSDLESFRDFMKRTTGLDNRNVQEAEWHFRQYRGSLFGGKDYVWSAGVAAELVQQYVSLTRMLVSYYRGRGNAAQAKETLRSYLLQVPLDEEMNGELLRLYRDLQERDAFARHYERYRQQLEKEVGVAPSEEMQAMARTIQ